MMNHLTAALMIVCWCVLLSLLSHGTTAFAPTPGATTRRQSSWSSSALAAFSASDLLYEDQRAAMARRSAFEETLLSKNTKELKAPKIKLSSGTGFGGGGGSAQEKLAAEQAKVVQRDGVLRINSALSPALADKLRAYVLEQEKIAEEETRKNPALSQAFYGVEKARKNRCDLQLSLLRGGFAADDIGAVVDEKYPHVVADALQELLGSDGTLRPLYENLVGPEGEFYELAAVITHPGSDRQQVHPDLPFRPNPPLYVVFLALQDVNESMGPTSFLLGTNTLEERIIFDDMAQRDEQLEKASCRLATLKKGDAVVFDARVLHCGNANLADSGTARAMFNFSFRSPKEKGDLGYPGSIRPAYCGAMTLGDVSNALAEYESGNKEPFAKYGNGL